tara:strand:- start:81444 stop:84473 length:3030 start_codon:yes stop_codon:yes gene_type:complete
MFSCPKSLSAIALVALAGSVSNAQSLSWGSAVDGDWELATNWDLGNIPDTISEDAVLGLLAPYTVSTNNNYTIGALSITNPGATLLLDSGRTFTLTKDLFNDGLIVVNDNASVFDTVLSFGSNATIDGTGSILLNANSSTADAQISSGALTITHNQGHTIMGSGRVSGFMTNHGEIIADQPKGSPLELTGTVDQGATGRIGADGGTLVLAGGSSMTGGELFTVNGGTVETTNSPSISNLSNTGDLHVPGSGSFLLINGDIENTGTISINSNTAVFNGHLRFDSDATIDGNGSISLALGGGGGDLGDAQLFTSQGITATIGAQQTVSGAGRINGNSGGQLINLGTFVADVPDTELQLQGSISGDGVYRSDNGIIGFGGGLVLDGGTFESSGSGIATHVSNGVSNLSNVTNNGEMGVNGNGGFVVLSGPLTNNGTFRINANRAVFNGHLRFDASTVIDGTGTIQMVSRGDTSDAQFFTNPGITGTIGGDQAVEGSGIVDGRDGGTILNLGTINGNHAAVDKDPALPLVLGGNHDGGGVGVYRSDNGILDLDGGLVLSGGIFDSSGVGIVTMLGNGVATLSNVTNNGQLGINGNGGFMSLVGPMTNNGTLTINANSEIFNAHLRFDASTHISGPGTIVMRSSGNSNDAQFYTGGVFHGIIGGDQTVMGSGMIDGRDGGTIVNLGTINGNDPDHLLELFGNHGGGGVYRSDNGTLALRSGMVLDGGTFDSSGTGIVEMVGNGTMSMGGVTNMGTLGARGEGGIIELTGPLTNNGTVLINSTQSIFNGHVRFAAETVIDGEGVIDMYVNNNFNDAQILNDAGFVGTIGDGQTIIGSGTLQGEMNMNGTIDPGSTFRRFDFNTLHLSASSHLIADLGGLKAGEFDRLLMGGGGSIDLSGTLTVNIDDGYQPQFGDTWDIVSGGTVNGEFDEVNLPDAIALGQVYRVLYTPTRAYVVLTCDADLTGDNKADFFDVSAFLDYFSANDPRADLDHNGMYDFFDVSVFLDYFGNGCKGE